MDRERRRQIENSSKNYVGGKAYGEAALFHWYAASNLANSLPYRKKYLLAGPHVIERAALMPVEKSAFLMACMLAQKNELAAEQILTDSIAPQPWRTAYAHLEEDFRRRVNAQLDKAGPTYEEFFPELASPSQRPDAGDLLSTELCLNAIGQRILMGLILGVHFPKVARSMAESWLDQVSGSARLGVGGISVDDSPMVTTLESGFALAQSVYEEWQKNANTSPFAHVHLESRRRENGQTLKQEQPATDFEEIGIAVLVGSARAAQAICEGIDLDKSGLDRWKVSIELLGFFLQFMSRRAFAKGGPQFRASVQDEVVPVVIEALIDASWNADNVEEGFDIDEWKQRVFVETLENINTAEFEYSKCRDLYTESKSDFLKDDSVAGMLAGNVVRILEIDDAVNARLLVWTTGTTALAGSGIVKAIDGAAGRARKD